MDVCLFIGGGGGGMGVRVGGWAGGEMGVEVGGWAGGWWWGWVCGLVGGGGQSMKHTGDISDQTESPNPSTATQR